MRGPSIRPNFWLREITLLPLCSLSLSFSFTLEARKFRNDYMQCNHEEKIQTQITYIYYAMHFLVPFNKIMGGPSICILSLSHLSNEIIFSFLFFSILILLYSTIMRSIIYIHSITTLFLSTIISGSSPSFHRDAHRHARIIW